MSRMIKMEKPIEYKEDRLKFLNYGDMGSLEISDYYSIINHLVISWYELQDSDRIEYRTFLSGKYKDHKEFFSQVAIIANNLKELDLSDFQDNDFLQYTYELYLQEQECRSSG